MSKNKIVAYGDEHFWAYDVALGVFMKYLIDAGEEFDQSQSPWLRDEIASWRVAAVVTDVVPSMDEFSEAQKSTFISLANAACERLGQRESIPASEMLGWNILEGEGVFPRGVGA